MLFRRRALGELSGAEPRIGGARSKKPSEGSRWHEKEPSSVDSGQVSAHYDKGVLKIKLAKKAEAKPKQIKVNVGSEKTVEAKVQGKAA